MFCVSNELLNLFKALIFHAIASDDLSALESLLIKLKNLDTASTVMALDHLFSCFTTFSTDSIDVLLCRFKHFEDYVALSQDLRTAPRRRDLQKVLAILKTFDRTRTLVQVGSYLHRHCNVEQLKSADPHGKQGHIIADWQLNDLMERVFEGRLRQIMTKWLKYAFNCLTTFNNAADLECSEDFLTSILKLVELTVPHDFHGLGRLLHRYICLLIPKPKTSWPSSIIHDPNTDHVSYDSTRRGMLLLK